jgi:hypothetical protein
MGMTTCSQQQQQRQQQDLGEHNKITPEEYLTYGIDEMTILLVGHRHSSRTASNLRQPPTARLRLLLQQ